MIGWVVRMASKAFLRHFLLLFFLESLPFSFLATVALFLLRSCPLTPFPPLFVSFIFSRPSVLPVGSVCPRPVLDAIASLNCLPARYFPGSAANGLPGRLSMYIAVGLCAIPCQWASLPGCRCIVGSVCPNESSSIGSFDRSGLGSDCLRFLQQILKGS